jgi:hypothetical protein
LIRQAREESPDPRHLEELMVAMENALAASDEAAVLKVLQQLVPEYSVRG